MTGRAAQRAGSGSGGLAAALAALLIASLLSGLLAGRFALSPQTVIAIFWRAVSGGADAMRTPAETVVMVVRLPRVMAGLGVGAGLALAGACYQGVFRNPLVSPFILGVSGGAGFGAAAAILFLGGDAFTIQLCAFAGGIMAVTLCHLLARSAGNGSPLLLILSGIVVGAVFTALLSLLKYGADPEDKLPLIEFWLMGSLAGVHMRDVGILFALLVPAAALLTALRWRITVLTLGDEEARSLGINVAWLRGTVLVLATLMAAASVSLAGVIGWVGLVIPHLARILVGPDFRRLVPVSLVLGGSYLVLADTVARTLTAAEIPLGIVTSLIGAPIFAFLIRKGVRGWS